MKDVVLVHGLWMPGQSQPLWDEQEEPSCVEAHAAHFLANGHFRR